MNKKWKLKKLTGKIIDISLIVGFLYNSVLNIDFLFSSIKLCLIISLVVAFIQILRMKKRLNRYYTCTVNAQNNECEIHFDPFFFFCYIDKKTFQNVQKDAITKARKKGEKVIGKTMTINRLNQYFNVIRIGTKKERWFAIIPSLFLTIGNLRNVLTLKLTEKIINILWKNQFIIYEYRFQKEVKE